MKKIKSLLIILLLFLISISLVGCTGSSKIKAEKFEKALDFSSNSYYQMQFKNRYYQFTLKTFKDVIYICYTYDKNEKDEVYLSYKNGKLSMCSNSIANNYYIGDDSDVKELEETLGLSGEDASNTILFSEIVQLVVFMLIDDDFAFLPDDKLKSLLSKTAVQSGQVELEEVNEYYQNLVNNSVFYKNFDNLEYKEKTKCYAYSDKECDIYYYFNNNKISKIEYKEYSEYAYEYSIDFSYKRESIKMPKYYKLFDSNDNPINVRLGERRDLYEDFANFKIDLSNGKFVLSDDDFGEINNTSHLLTINTFTKLESAYVLYVDDKYGDITYIFYKISK